MKHVSNRKAPKKKRSQISNSKLADKIFARAWLGCYKAKGEIARGRLGELAIGRMAERKTRLKEGKDKGKKSERETPIPKAIGMSRYFKSKRRDSSLCSE